MPEKQIKHEDKGVQGANPIARLRQTVQPNVTGWMVQSEIRVKIGFDRAMHWCHDRRTQNRTMNDTVFGE